MTKPLDLPGRVQLRRHTEGVAVVMPAYCEEENLARTVTDFLATLEEAGVPHAVVVTNDGSKDRTGQILDRLARWYPGRVIAVHHAVNQGYGAAVRSAIHAALNRTDMRWILLTDSDGQFRAADVLTFLQVQRSERADAVIGYRRERADPTARKVNAWLWTRLSQLVLGVRSRDVDCAFKLIDRSLLEGVELTGEAAAISPEILAKISVGGSRIVQHPVGHYPREHGEQTGARLSVIVRSLLSLARVRLQLTRRWFERMGVHWPADPVAVWVTLGAAIVSAYAYLFFLDEGTLLDYKDANSHLLIARRVLDSPTPGLAQLGGVWLPLPHILSIPLIWHDQLYQSGFAGAVVSMIGFIVAVRYLYGLGTVLAGTRLAGLAAAIVFAVNANVLYLQSTAMTELLLFACVVAAIYHLHEWCRKEHYRDLITTSIAVCLATLTRYEGWVLCLAVLVVVIYTQLRRHRDYVRAESFGIFYAIVAMSGIAGWMVWNFLIFKNPFYWHNGEYAEPSLWVKESEAAVGRLDVAAEAYWLAMVHNIGLPTILLGAVGVVAYVVRTRLRPDSSAVYPLLAFGPFFVYALYSGQRPLHVKEIDGELYNVRFGLIMLLPAVVFAGYLVSLAVPAMRLLHERRSAWLARSSSQHAGFMRLARMLMGVGRGAARFGRILAGSRVRPRFGGHDAALIAQAAVALLVMLTALGLRGVVTLDEAREYQEGQWANAAVSAWLRANHDGGLTLMMSYANESVVFDSRIDTGAIVYEGSYRLWEAALDDPAGEGIEWIYMRAEPGDEDAVWKALFGTRQLAESYDLVYDHGHRLVYQRKESP